MAGHLATAGRWWRVTKWNNKKQIAKQHMLHAFEYDTAHCSRVSHGSDYQIHLRKELRDTQKIEPLSHWPSGRVESLADENKESFLRTHRTWFIIIHQLPQVVLVLAQRTTATVVMDINPYFPAVITPSSRHTSPTFLVGPNQRSANIAMWAIDSRKLIARFLTTTAAI